MSHKALLSVAMLFVVVLMVVPCINAQTVDTLLIEDFEGAFLPAGWDTMAGGSNPTLGEEDWYQSGAPIAPAEFGLAAAIRYVGSSVIHNDWLMSPVMYPGVYDSVHFSFRHRWRTWSSGTGSMYIVFDQNPNALTVAGDTLDWENQIWEYSAIGASIDSTEDMWFDISAWVAASDSFRIGWVYKRDNDYYWAVDSVEIMGFAPPGDFDPPIITHTPLGNQAPGLLQYQIDANITDNVALEPDSSFLYYSTGGGFTRILMNFLGGAAFQNFIPGQSDWTIIRYFITACDTSGNCATTDTFQFSVIGEYFAYDDVDLYPEAPVYNWIELQGVVAPSTLGDEDDNWAGWIMPFTFRFYGTDYDTIFVSTNGRITFTRPSTVSDFTNDPMPDADNLDCIVAPFWDDLNPGYGGDIYVGYDAVNHYLIVEWKECHHYYSGDPETFEAIIYDPDYYTALGGNGEIVTQYNVVARPTGCSVGLEDETQLYGYQYLYNGTLHPDAAGLANGRAIKFTTDPPPSGGIEGIALLDGRVDHSNIQVTVDELGTFVFSDATGYFIFPYVPPGTYTVIGTFAGFYPDTAFAVTVLVDDTAWVDLYLMGMPIGYIQGFADLTDTGPLGDPGINIILQGTGLADVTDAAGGYFFDAVEAGMYSVIGTQFGYTTEAQTITVNETETTYVDTLFLDPAVPWWVEDFDDDDGGLIPFPPDGGWQWGMPGAPGPDPAHSAPNCWGTVLTANYGVDLADWTLDVPLTSPTSYFTFWHWYNMETNFDGGQIYTSINNGRSWDLWTPPAGYPSVISTFFSSPIAGQPAYSGIMTTWTQVMMDLTGLNGAVTHIRFRFCSDELVNSHPGWYVDDFEAYSWPSGSIEGRVYDITTFEPLDGARVVAAGGSDYTDETGYFFLPQAPIGMVELGGHMTGYFSAYTNVVVYEGFTTYADLYLYPIEIEIPIEGDVSYEGSDTLFFEFCNTSNSVIDYYFSPVGGGIIWERPLTETPEFTEMSSVLDRPRNDVPSVTRDPEGISDPRSIKRTMDYGDIVAAYDLTWISPVSLAWGLGLQGDEYFWVSDPAIDRGTNHNFAFSMEDGSYTGIHHDTAPWCGVFAADMAWDGEKMWQVAVGGTNKIYAWDRLTGAVVDSLGGPWTYTNQRGLAYDPEEDVFWIGGWWMNQVYKIRGTSWAAPGTIIDSFAVPFSVAGLGWHAGRRTVWISHNAASDMIQEVNPETGEVINTIFPPGDGTGFGGAGLEVDYLGRIWYACQSLNTVFVIDTGFPVLPPAVSIDPMSGSLNPGECVTIRIIVQDEDPLPGLYEFDIYLYVTDQVPPVRIPVRLNVAPSLNQGWNLVAFPVDADPNDFYAQLSDDIIPFYYSPTRSSIYAYNPEDATYYLPSHMERAVGYYLSSWAWRTLFDVTGNPYETDTLLTLPYHSAPRFAGWHLVGNAFNRKLDWNAVVMDPEFFNMNQTYFTWTPRGWAFYNPGVPGGAPRYINPWRGFFAAVNPGLAGYGILPMKMSGTTAMLKAQPEFVEEKVAPKTERDSKNQTFLKTAMTDLLPPFNLRVSIKGYRGAWIWDRYNYISVAQSALDGWDNSDVFDCPIEPPPGSSIIPAYFSIPGDDGEFCRDTRPIFEGVKEWNFTIECGTLTPGRTVSIVWPKVHIPSVDDASFGIDNIDTRYTFTLIDEHSGVETDMRTDVDTTYTFTPTTPFHEFTFRITTYGIATDIEEKETLPTTFALHQNVPNPFNATTTFKVAVPEESHVKLSVYNILGQEIKTLVNEDMNAGYYQIMWDGRTNTGSEVGSGIYFYEMKTEKFLDKKKMVIIK
ncbi:T9SS type A sorting domain-containing protein [bacterium]|nr:T9SS type A sorting domain-containing protein [bacterium]